MNHQKIYNWIVNRAKNRELLSAEYEIHHIVPKSIGGTNDFENLVKLTYKEHYVCHRLLTFIFSDVKEIHFAYWMMSNRFKDKLRITAKTYRLCKLNYIKYRQGISLSEEVKLKISISRKKNSNDWWIGRKHSVETKIKQSISALNRNITEENELKRRAGISKSNLGKSKTEEHCKNISISKTGEKNPMYGKTGKNNVNSKIIYQYTLDKIFIKQWDNAKIASKELNISYQGIRMCVTNKTKSSGKFIWTDRLIN